MIKSKWDVQEWLIGVLVLLALSLGGYAWSSMKGEVEDLKTKTAVHATADAQEFERLKHFDEAMSAISVRIEKLETGLRADIKDVRDLLIKTHIPELRNQKTKFDYIEKP